MPDIIDGSVDFHEAPIRVVARTYNDLAKRGVITRSPDMIPYSECFERLFARVQPMLALTHNEVFCVLMNARKQKLIKTTKWKMIREDESND